MAPELGQGDGVALGQSSNHAHGLFSEALDFMMSLPAKEIQAFTDVLNGKGTLGEYAAVGLPLLAIGIATDGLGLTAINRAPQTMEIGGTAVRTVNALGLGSIAAVVGTTGLAARQYFEHA